MENDPQHKPAPRASLVRPNDVVLFQGDSITDCGRNRAIADHLGSGYAQFVAGAVGSDYPEWDVAFLNRGVGGDRVRNLRSRWQEDCLNLQPTVVSIYIGINDTWRRYDQNDPTSAADFKETYRALIETTKQKLDARLILVEPFVLAVTEDRRAWREDLDPKIHAVRDLAREYGTAYVPLDGLFAQATTRRAPTYWAPDGVHPSLPGHMLIAKAWLQAAGLS